MRGRRKPLSGMLPANEGLEADDLAIVQSCDWLIVDDQLLKRRGLDLRCLRRKGVDEGSENDHQSINSWIA